MCKHVGVAPGQPQHVLGGRTLRRVEMSPNLIVKEIRYFH